MFRTVAASGDGFEVIFSIWLSFKYEKLTILRISQQLKFLNTPVKPSHQEQPDCHAVRYKYCIIGEVLFFKITVKGVEEIAHPVVYISA